MTSYNIVAQADTAAKSSKKISALDIFKENIDIGQAFVSVLSHTGIAGFKFNVPEREQVKMQSEVTDHYIDSNNPVQDHVARKPVTITLTGLQGDYFYSVNKIEDFLAQVTPTLKLVQQFIPRLTAATEQIKNFNKNYWSTLRAQKKYNNQLSANERFKTAWDTLNGMDLFSLMQDLVKLKSAQTRAFLFFEALWGGTWRTTKSTYNKEQGKWVSEGQYNPPAVFTVETTWRRYDNMVITDLTPVRDNNMDITEFTVTFKQIHVTASLVTDLNNYAGRTREQLAQINNKGVDKGVKTDV